MAWENEWEKTRKWGRLKYSILHGFSFAILFSLIMLAWDAFEHKVSFRHTAILTLLNFIAMSLIQYLILWPLNERYYKKRKQSRP